MEVMGERNRGVVVLGASAGGVPALQEVVWSLADGLDAAVFVVLHVGASDRSCLAAILGRRSHLAVTQAEDGEPIRRGHVYVARPDYHLIVESETVRLARGPRENRTRPSIDALFRSAAFSHGSAVIGVVLSGTLDDGSAGLWWIKDRGGTAIVQDPASAQFAAMPQNALLHTRVDHVVPGDAIGRLLNRLTAERAGEERSPSGDLAIEVQIARDGDALKAGVFQLGQVTPYTCPDCHGVLIQTREGGLARFRCHTGHAYSINTLLAGVTEYVEETLWNSIRSIEESALLLRQFASEATAKGVPAETVELYEEKAVDTLRRADRLREVVHAHQTLSTDNIEEVEPGSR